MKSRRILFYVLGISMMLGLAGFTYAAFMDKSEILGSSFSVGSADIKLLADLTQGTVESNLVDAISGPQFSGIHAMWQQDYTLKLFNNTAEALSLSSNANYETANDPAELRQIIFVEPFDWADENNNGSLDEGELGGSYGRKTIVKWKTEGFDMGTLSVGQVRGILLRFSTDAVSETKQGASALFDFTFNSVGN